ncbi:MAG TPA: nitroreductase/quinone reductase family protein [Pseudonocardiaceae bacterium]|nr:nitroreductase/quinone reductase family protein [Pseudonocardiaceae bacterium]
MPDADRLEFNRAIAEQFRAHGGHLVSGRLAGHRVLLLHTVGARTGQPRMSPLGYLPDGDRWVVFAANAGRPVRPGWYHNLVARPEATIEVGTDTIPVVARVADGTERSRVWERVVVEVPSAAVFQQTAPGPIPVVVLTRRTRVEE